MTLTFREFNLTEYSDLRQLEFQYTKTQDENQNLKYKLATLQNAYKIAVKQLKKNEVQLKENEEKWTSCQEEGEEKMKRVQEKIGSIGQQLDKFQNMGIDIGQHQDIVDAEESPQNNILSQLVRLQHCFLFLLSRNTQMNLNYSKELQTYKSQIRLQRQVEQQYKEELDYLSCELSRLQKTNTSLSNELGLVRRENKDLKLKVYQFGEQTDLVRSRMEDQTIQDNNFTVDLLHYQKELLERTFAKIIAAVQTQSLSSVLTEIYEGCKAVGEAARQKLQIEYDLQDLEQEYRRQKNSKVNEKLLIQLRKQIQEFRHELQKQKDTLGKEQMILEELLLVLRGTEREQKQIRKYTVEVKKQIHELKGSNEVTTKETKRQSQSNVKESSRIRFRTSENGDEVMREAVRRDRENIQKMFKQTRRTYLKGTD